MDRSRHKNWLLRYPVLAPGLMGPLGGIFLLAAAGVAWGNGEVVGIRKCAECHQSEVKAWQGSPHAQAAFANLSHDKAPQFARAMGISGDLQNSMCAECHASEHTVASGRVNGVSCEACHNPAGPDTGDLRTSGWVLMHHNFGVPFQGQGSPIANRTKETPARRAKRVEYTSKQGMIRSDNLFEIAQNCLGCHTVPNEKLVNAGHPTSSRFELVRWSQGAVRHNFGLDQAKNAEAPTLWLNPIPARPNRSAENRNKLMFAVGQLADLEFSLRQRATAKDGDYGKACGGRIDDAKDELEDMEHIPEIKQALAAVAEIDRRRLGQFGAGDQEFFTTAADGVLAAARAFIENHPDGDDLGEIKPPRRTEGKPYEP